MKKWSELSKKSQRLILATSASFVLAGGFGGYVGYAQNQHESAKQIIETSLKSVGITGAITQTVRDFADEEGYLAKDLDVESIKAVQKQLDTLKKQVEEYQKEYPNDSVKDAEEIDALQEKVKDVERKLLVQDHVNHLFQQETLAINGSEVQDSVTLADAVDRKIVQGIDYQPFEKDKWKEAIEKLIKQAHDQLNEIEEAEKLVTACYKENKVKTDVSKKAYEDAKKAVDKIKRKSDKDALEKKLAEIKKVIDANEKKAKEATEKKKKEQAKKEADQKAAQTGGTVVEKEDGSYEVAVADESSSTYSDGPSGNGSNGSAYSSAGSSSANNGGYANGTTAGGGSNSSGSTNNKPSGNANTSNNQSAGGNSGNNTGGQGSQNNNSGSNNSNGGGSSTPTTPSAPTIVSGYIGNSGKIFDTAFEANTWANGILDTDFSKNGYYLIGIFYSDGTEKFSIDWY